MKKISKNLVGMLILLILLILILAGIYVFGASHYTTHFFPNTTINGISVGDMTVEDVKYAIQSVIRNYTLTIRERGDKTETLTGDQIYLQYVDDGEIQKCLDSQNPYSWPFRLASGRTFEVPVGYTYDKSVIDSVLDSMACFQPENEVPPTDAMILENETGLYTIQESVEGTQLDREKTRLAIMQAIEAGETYMDFEELDLYQKAPVGSSNEDLVAKLNDANTILSTDLVYDFVDRQFVVDETVVRDFMKKDKNGNYKIDHNKVTEWVQELANETDTFGLPHEFTTHSGRTIMLAAGGDYGWVINVEETASDLYNAILEGRQGEIEPMYVYRALDRSSNDIGDTYVEICIESQTMWCYVDGQVVVDTYVVTGNHAMGQDTPSGCVWAIDGKEADATFNEAGGVKVKYWLPFVDSCGIHDASWRGAAEYGGTTWLYNGSNGCVNTPEEAAARIFYNMEVGYPVVVYYSEDQPVGTQPKVAAMPG